MSFLWEQKVVVDRRRQLSQVAVRVSGINRLLGFRALNTYLGSGIGCKATMQLVVLLLA